LLWSATVWGEHTVLAIRVSDGHSGSQSRCTFPPIGRRRGRAVRGRTMTPPPMTAAIAPAATSSSSIWR